MENKIIKVAGAIIKIDNNYLIGRRGPNESSPGLWEFPGGKIEKDESPQDCIKRELEEELNIDAEIGDLYTNYIYEYPNISYDLYFYKILRYKGYFIKSAHDKLKWVRLEEFRNFDFLPGDDPLIEKLYAERD